MITGLHCRSHVTTRCRGSEAGGGLGTLVIFAGYAKIPATRQRRIATAKNSSVLRTAFRSPASRRGWLLSSCAYLYCERSLCHRTSRAKFCSDLCKQREYDRLKSASHIRLCAQCGIDISGAIKTQRYCGKACSKTAANERARGKTENRRQMKYGNRKCSECQKFVPIGMSYKAKTCSKECSASRGKRVQRENPTNRKTYGACRFQECGWMAITRPDGKGKAAGYCEAHGRQIRLGKPLSPIVRKTKKQGICKFDDCGRHVFARGYCRRHYSQFIEGSTLTPITSIRSAVLPVGSVNIKQDGYIRVKTESGWDTQHRIVMSDFIGRPLLPHELVHHKNGIRTDNRIENLELCSRYQPPSQRISDQLEWAREIISLYAGLPLFDTQDEPRSH